MHIGQLRAQTCEAGSKLCGFFSALTFKGMFTVKGKLYKLTSTVLSHTETLQSFSLYIEHV